MDTIEFNYNEELNIATCIITKNNIEYTGTAVCHPDDLDFESERTGLAIAEARARIKALKGRIKHDITPILKSYNHLQSCMETNKNYNPKSYEGTMVRRKIKQFESDLATTELQIAQMEQNLKEYIEEKDKIYNKIRDKRNQTSQFNFYLI